MRRSLAFQRVPRRAALFAAIAVAGPIAFSPRPICAEGLFDFLFGGFQKPLQRETSPQASYYADPSNGQPQQAPLPRAAMAFCVRSCDGKYFPLMRGNASPVAICQSFCPASATKVFFGSNIDGATSSGGERYADSENAYGYRKALRADCTCNGRDPAGLAPVDLTLDASLRAGDVIATTDGLVAYSGIKVGNNNSPEFIPVATYPGLTAEVRARLGNVKVAPIAAEANGNDAPNSDIAAPTMPAAKPHVRDKQAALN